jgi:hypothetical protein
MKSVAVPGFRQPAGGIQNLFLIWPFVRSYVIIILEADSSLFGTDFKGERFL